MQAWGVHAGTDPERRWYTLTTPHFSVHSYGTAQDMAASEAFAKRAAGYLEEAHNKVGKTLGWQPDERVEVTIVDNVDAANGFARVMPYNHIELLAFPPAGHSGLGDYDDWLRLLIFHEYAHIVHLDNATGVPAVVNDVLGRAWKPNQALPRWLTEGLATWIESRTSGAGRVTGALFQMFARAAALEDRLPTLSELSGPPLFEPGGASWYLYGGYTFDTIAKHAGAPAIAAWARGYGRRMIPYSINQTMQTHTGKGLDTWYGMALDGVRRRAEDVAKRVRAEGRKEGIRKTTDGEFKGSPVVTPDGRALLYVANDGRSSTYLVRAPVEAIHKQQRWIKCEGGCQSIEPIDGRTCLIGTTRYHRRVNAYSDVVRIDLRPGQRTTDGHLLTRGARAQRPRLGADGRLWVVKSSWGKTWLEALDPHSGDTQWRWDPPAWARLGTPAPSRDGRIVYLSMHHDGNRDLYALNVRSRRLKRLTYGSALEVNLRMGPQGRYLYYSSDADGVFNIYARELATQATFKVTNVLGGAFDPAPTPDGSRLFYRGWSADGWDIYELPLTWEDTRRIAVADPRRARTARHPPRVKTKRSTYDPFPTIRPRVWLPTWSLDSTGLSRLGLLLGGVDVSDRLGLLVGLDIDIARRDVDVVVDVDLRWTWPDLRLRLGRYSWDGSLTRGDVRGDYRGEVYYAQFDMGLALPNVVTPMHFKLGATVDYRRGLTVPALKHTPDENMPIEPYEGMSAGWRMSLSWADSEQPKWAVTPIRGGTGSFAVSLRHPALGGHTDDFRFTYSLKRYIQMPFHTEHVVMLRANGGWATNGTFSLGGIPDQDIWVDLLNEQQAASTYLRGYAPGAFRGPAYHLVSTEYRFPIWRIRASPETLPLFIRDIHGAVFSDVGVAYQEPFDDIALQRVRASVGLELRVDLELLFGLGLNLRVGYARGLANDGKDHVYFMLAPPP